MMLDEQFFQLLQLIQIHWTDASYHVVSQFPLLVGYQINGVQGMVEATLALAEGIVGLTQAIQTEGDAAQSSFH